MGDARGIPVTFSARDERLEPTAVAALGAAARALGRHLLQCSDERLAAWTAVAGTDALFVLGASDSLPWVDGVFYLGRAPGAPRLFVPTTLRPTTIAMELFEAAILSHAPALVPPLAVMVAPHRIVSLAGALPIGRQRLRAWLGLNA